MLNRRKRLMLIGSIAVVSLLAYGLIPLESKRFTIKVDQKLAKGKKDFLRSVPPTSADSSAQNVIWIILDDLSLADTDLYVEGPVAVPNLNKLADEGVKFTNAYVTSPVCSPSRAAIMTGRYNQRFGFEHQMHERYLKNRLEYFGFKYLIDSGPWEPQYQTEVPNYSTMRSMGLPESEITLAEIAKRANYNTGYIGKWHLGKKKSKSPRAFGFDHFYGFYSSHSLYAPETDPEIVSQRIEDDFTDEYIWEGGRNDLQAIRLNDKEIKEERYLTEAITEESISFIRQYKDVPFYLVVSYNAPHTPLQAKKEYVAMYNDEKDPIKRVHYAMIKCLDDQLGKLMASLEHNNLSNNTLVMLISDNGGAEYNLTTSNGPYQGGKITNFEGGVKVPMLMRYPGIAPERTIYPHPVHATDLFATSLDVIGLKPPSDRRYDGENLLDHIGNSTIPHEYIYFAMGKNKGIRDSRWKLTWNEDNGDSTLYDLKTDPFEQDNLYSQNDQVVKILASNFKRWTEGNSDPLWPSMINYHYLADDGQNYYFDE